MICLHNLMFLSDLDLNVEAQNWCFLRISAEGSHASRQTRFLTGHDLFAVDHLSTMRGCPSRRTQGQGFFLSGSILRHGVCALDVSEILARYRSQFARASASAASHEISLLDLRGSIPSFIRITEVHTDGKTHEVNMLDDLVIEPGAYYLMDRGYLDFARLFKLHVMNAFFVTRVKSNTKFKRRYSHPVDRTIEQCHMRSNGCAAVFLFEQGLSGDVAARRRQKRHWKTPHLFDQQLRSKTRDDRGTLQATLASRIVLQMDQATFAYQSLFRHQRECREDADMDRGRYLCPHRYRQKTPAFASQPVRNSTKPEPHHV